MLLRVYESDGFLLPGPLRRRLRRRRLPDFFAVESSEDESSGLEADPAAGELSPDVFGGAGPATAGLAGSGTLSVEPVVASGGLLLSWAFGLRPRRRRLFLRFGFGSPVAGSLGALSVLLEPLPTVEVCASALGGALSGFGAGLGIEAMYSSMPMAACFGSTSSVGCSSGSGRTSAIGRIGWCSRKGRCCSLSCMNLVSEPQPHVREVTLPLSLTVRSQRGQHQTRRTSNLVRNPVPLMVLPLWACID